MNDTNEAGEIDEAGVLSFTCTMKRGDGARRQYRVTVHFVGERPQLVAEDGFDPDAIDAEFLHEGEWHEVTKPSTLRRLRGAAEDLRWEPKRPR